MIIVFGSINFDFVVSVDHLPLPGETVLGDGYQIVPGGKGGNQACAAARAIAQPAPAVVMIGMVGPDPWADTSTRLLADASVILDRVGTADAATGCAAIMVDQAGENAIAVASGANRYVRADQVPDSLLGPDHWLVLQMEVPHDQNWALVARAQDRGARIILNVAPAAAVPAAVLDAIDVLVVNEIEARQVARALGQDDGTPEMLAAMIGNRHRLVCVVTLGSAGVIAWSDGDMVRVPALPVDVRDTTGAGDCFVGVLAAGLAMEAPLSAALERAACAAGLCCGKAGAQSSFPRAQDIDAAVRTLPSSPARAAAD